MENENQVKYDVDGYEFITSAIMELVNQYPGLYKGEKIAFSDLSEDGGIAMFPITGAVIEAEKTSVTGKVYQTCLYPFFIIYRLSLASSKRKQSVKEWLDDLGRWLEGQKINVDGAEHRLLAYPSLTDNRKFLSISRQTPAYLDNTSEGGVEDWAVYISARYSNQFNKRL